jgi:Na+/glutamate symporter
MAGSIFACVGLAAAIASMVSGGFVGVTLVLAVALLLYVGNIRVLSRWLAQPVRG